MRVLSPVSSTSKSIKFVHTELHYVDADAWWEWAFSDYYNSAHCFKAWRFWKISGVHFRGHKKRLGGVPCQEGTSARHIASIARWDSNRPECCGFTVSVAHLSTQPNDTRIDKQLAPETSPYVFHWWTKHLVVSLVRLHCLMRIYKVGQFTITFRRSIYSFQNKYFLHTTWCQK